MLVYTDYLRDVIGALEKCLKFTEGMQFSKFTEDEKTIFTVATTSRSTGQDQP